MSIRKQGIKKLLIRLIAFILISYFVYWLQTKGYNPNSFAMTVLSAPIALGLAGFLERVMNRPFSKMES